MTGASTTTAPCPVHGCKTAWERQDSRPHLSLHTDRGKPPATAMGVIGRRLGVEPDRLLVVGDDLSLEIRMARAAGAVAVLTTTGTHDARDAADVAASDRSDLVMDSLLDLVRLWEECAAVTCDDGG
jgi:ribonucleotide monophosphatase NagD (HAD superfamily)